MILKLFFSSSTPHAKPTTDRVLSESLCPPQVLAPVVIHRLALDKWITGLKGLIGNVVSE